MSAEVKMMLEPEDPRIIRGVYNYCHRWCDRCPFTDRCILFRENERFETEHPDSTPFEHVHASFQQTIERLKSWCVREGIDFAQIQQEARSDAAITDQRMSHESVAAQPLSKLAKAYFAGTWEIVRAIERSRYFSEWEPRVHDAVSTIGWYAAFIGAKIDRALHGMVWSPDDDRSDEDEIQNDWNGSAKAALMAIEESRKAWLVVLEAGRAPADSPLMGMVDLLAKMDSGIGERFPRAMLFVRPGFDEPDVAAGALSTLECFDRRPLSIVRNEKGPS